MNATTVSKEAVRLLAIEIGLRPAARKLGLNEDTVCSWAKRETWFASPANPQTLQAPQAKPGDVLINALQHHEGQTRLTLAKYASNAAAAIHKSVHPAKYTRQAKDIAGVMATVHRQDEQKPGATFSLNVLNLSMFSDDTTPTLDE